MRDDFAILILTHGRPREQRTYRALLNAGYTGKVYFVVDDLDETLDEYKRLYGDQVIVFDKEAEYRNLDTLSNQKRLTAVVYARNASFEIARRLGLRYFVNCDDDIRQFQLKFVRDKLITKNIANFDTVLESLIEYMQSAQIECCSISEAGAYIGGANKYVQSGWNWSFTHFFLFDVNSDMRYRSFWYEDLLFSLDYQSIGRLMYCTYFVSQVMTTPDELRRQTGGMREEYRNSNSYEAEFISVITHPECTHIVFDKERKQYIRRVKKNFIPKIINEKWRKGAGHA